MSVDLASICFGFATFSVFLMVFLITLRFVSAKQIFVMIKRVFFLGLVSNIFLVVNASFILEHAFSYHEQVILGIVSLLIYGMTAFVFVLCFFGPNETSIRMRLIHIIGQQSMGVSRQEIARQYNNQSMLEVRLKRLIGAGDVKESNGKYKILNAGNAFFMIDRCAGVLKKLYGLEEKS